MPYIEQKLRDILKQGYAPAGPGEINYLLTKVIVDYLQLKGLQYIRINDVVGALECCKLEFYRRVAVPYEEHKRDANSDVYPENF